MKMKSLLVWTCLVVLFLSSSAQEREVEFVGPANDDGSEPGNTDEPDVEGPVGEGDEVGEEEGEEEDRVLPDFGGSSEDYVDKILIKVKKSITEKNLDPLKLPDKENSFKKKLFWKKTIKGGIRFDDGILKGLSTIHRRGDTKLSYRDDKLVMEATLGFNYLTLASDLKVWFSIFKIKGSAAASVSSVTIYMKLSQDSSVTDGTNNKPTLEEFEIKDVGKVHTSTKGLGPLGWTLSKVTNCLGNLVVKAIASEVEGPIEQLLRKNLNHFDFTL